MRRPPLATALAVVFLVGAATIGAGREPEAVTDEARISLDMKDADARDAVRVLAELGDLQAVFDPDVSCRLTLKFHALPLEKALEAVLAACELGLEGEGHVFRVALRQRLIAEDEARRKLKQQRRGATPRRLVVRRLSYARAEELAPIVQKLLSPEGQVITDRRTNTLIIID